MDTICCDSLDSNTPSPACDRSQPVATYFAPAGRDPVDELQRKATTFQDAALLCEALSAMPNMVMVLNSNRQIVGANDAMLTVLNTTVGEVAGTRPGEAVGCIHAKDGPNGCGTDRHCATCGAVTAILESQAQNTKVVRECRILAEQSGEIVPLDLRVTASPIQVAEERFVLASVEDISASKRLDVLQRVFFHDVLNTAGCIQGYAQCLQEDGTDGDDVCGRLTRLSEQLIESIRVQRDLLCAEAGELTTQPKPVQVRAVLEDVGAQYAKHPVAEGRTIELFQVWDGSIVADRQLLLRVLENMVKNALEATASGSTVTLGCYDRGDQVVFWVRNPDVIPETVQLQMFQRSFTTKGEQGRGIGTYSMKLFGERYLGGKVEFTSQSPDGTTFTFTLPKAPSPPKS